MFESDPNQARIIADASRKMVIVPSTGEIFLSEKKISVPPPAPVIRFKYPEIKTRNLLYHVYAPVDVDEWKMNVAELVKHWDVFNGKKIICVAKEDRLHATAFVRDHFPGDAEFYQIQNDKALREQVTFEYLLSRWKTSATARRRFTLTPRERQAVVRLLGFVAGGT